MDLELDGHISGQFNDELEKLRQRVLSLGGLVEDQTIKAVEALMAGDAAMGKDVAKRDKMINQAEVQIDEECTRLIAMRHPAASDLRLIISVIKTITDLERIGDEAKKVAKLSSQLTDSQIERGDIRQLGEHVARMIHDALDAFARVDAQAALEVVKEDAEVDREYSMITQQLMSSMKNDSDSVVQIMNLLWALRALERIGDHAKNIAEYVIYLASAKDVRHASIEEKSEVATGQ